MYNIIILTGIHLDRKTEEPNKVGKTIQEYHIFNVQDKEKLSDKNGVTIGIEKQRAELENIRTIHTKYPNIQWPKMECLTF